MRSRLLATVLVALIAALVLVAPSAAARKCTAGPLTVIETMTAGLPDHPDTWYGTVRGDIQGTEEGWGLAFDPATPVFGGVSPIFLGGVGPGYGVITTDRGRITFYKMDVYIEGVWEFRNVGFVTDATGHWKYLIGWTTYAYGFTTDPNTWGDQYTCRGYRVFLPPLPARWGKLGVEKPAAMWPDIFTR
jgi:hypothetical protein